MNNITIINVNTGELPVREAASYLKHLSKSIERIDPCAKFIICPVREYDVGKVSVVSPEDRIVVLSPQGALETSYEEILEYFKNSRKII